ncbi:MAG: cytochrome c1 [Gammaproteobacteria bacterium]|nr:cytochrome c1 [Gammaproteobacteria bacterium]
MRMAFLFLCIGAFAFEALGKSDWPIDEARINLRDNSSLQRGAQLFVNYCQGCHSAKFVRFRSLAEDIGIVDSRGKVLSHLVKENLMLYTNNIEDTLLSSLSAEDAKKMFAGVTPPDLSLIARKYGADWLYTYLRSFYKDETKSSGANNALVPNVAMPNVLGELQGVQIPVYKDVQKKQIEKLELKEPGKLSTPEYDKQVADLVNFLVYMGEPVQLTRRKVGVWVVISLLGLVLWAYFLKREYWKDITAHTLEK